MTRLVIRNLGGAISGLLGDGVIDTETLVCADGLVTMTEGDQDVDGSDQVVDARGAIAAPGLIDSHVHVVFGDWTPRQHALGWIASSIHGGVTTMVSASEVHLPGRPTDPAGIKALAVAAHRAYEAYRPGGMKVFGGSVIIEPGLTEKDFAELAGTGVWLAKVGFGNWARPSDAAATVRIAQSFGFKVMCHAGGASIPGSSAVSVDDIVALSPDIIGHANGGTTSLPDEDLIRLFREASGAIQLVQAGNLRSALAILELAEQEGAMDRILIASDTPSGTGVMPLAMLKSVVELSSLGGLDPADVWAYATGNPARVLNLPQGTLVQGAPADIILMHAPFGGTTRDALAAIRNGDIPAITGVISEGEFLALRSRNTPAPVAEVQVIGDRPKVALA